MSLENFWWTQRQVNAAESDCDMALRGIVTAKRIEDVVRHVNHIAVPSMVKQIVRPAVARVKQAAEQRIDALLKELEPGHRYAAYRALCGHFPRQAQQLHQQMQADRHNR